jgi:hypothetical protein
LRSTLAACAALTALLPAAPALAEPVVLEPGSQWSVDFDKDKCRLIRLFGPESDRNVLILEQYTPAATFSMTVAGSAFGSIAADKANTIRFLPDAAPAKHEPLVGPLEGYGRSLFFLSVGLTAPDKAKPDAKATAPSAPMLDASLAEQVRFVEIGDADRQVRLMTGPLDRPVKVMNECLLDLIASWGLDPEQHRTATRNARLLNEQAAMQKLYSYIPWSRIGKNNEMAVMRIRLITTVDGKVESCALVENSDPKLEAATCKGLRQARLEPALDAAGKPMRSHLAITMYFGPVVTVTQTIPG